MGDRTYKEGKLGAVAVAILSAQVALQRITCLARLACNDGRFEVGSRRIVVRSIVASDADKVSEGDVKIRANGLDHLGLVDSSM